MDRRDKGEVDIREKLKRENVERENVGRESVGICSGEVERENVGICPGEVERENVERENVGEELIQVLSRRLVVTSPQLTTEYDIEKTMGIRLSLAHIRLQKILYGWWTRLGILF